MIEWHKIDNEKIQKIVKIYDEDNTLPFLKLMAKNAGVELDKRGNLPMGFIWEDGYNAGLPRENNKKYIGYDFDSDEIYMMYYDEEQESAPCFWDSSYNDTVFPDFWAEAEILKPIKTDFINNRRIKMKTKWIFFEYNDQKKDFPDCPFSAKVFYNFDKMKLYSAEVSVKNKHKCVDYASTYIKVMPIKS